MDHLQVEELEPRQLLSHTGLPVQPPLEKPPDNFAAWVAEHVSLVHSVADFGLADQYRLVRAEAAADLPRIMAVMGLEGRGPATFAHDMPPPGPGGARLEKWGEFLSEFGKDFPGRGLDALGIAGNSRPNAPSLPAAPLQAVSNSYATLDTLVVLSGPAAVLNLPPHSVSPSPASAHGLGLDVPFSDAIRPPAVAGTGRDGVFTIDGNGGEARWQPPPLGADSVPSVPNNERSESPLPLVTDMARALLPVNLSALELGLQQFLAQLEQSGHHLVGEFEEADLSPWIIAVAAAATACEIARRQLRTPAEQLDADMQGFSGFPPDAPLAG
jgi:hypothetical protein